MAQLGQQRRRVGEVGEHRAMPAERFEMATHQVRPDRNERRHADRESSQRGGSKPQQWGPPGRTATVVDQMIARPDRMNPGRSQELRCRRNGPRALPPPPAICPRPMASGCRWRAQRHAGQQRESGRGPTASNLVAERHATALGESRQQVDGHHPDERHPPSRVDPHEPGSGRCSLSARQIAPHAHGWTVVAGRSQRRARCNSKRDVTFLVAAVL
jgi:hypothetical protein